MGLPRSSSLLTRATLSTLLPALCLGARAMSGASGAHELKRLGGGTLVLEPRSGASSTVIFMHGLGDSAQGWVDTVAGAFAPALRATRFVLLTAPTRPITVNGGMRMPGWYDITSFDRDSMINGPEAEGLSASRARVHAAIAAEAAAGVPAARVVLGGFSQGGALSLDAGLSAPETLAGILCLSGYLAFPGGLAPSPAAALTPVLMLHGEEDPLVLPAFGAASADRIRAVGVKDVTLKTYPDLPHSVNDEELADALRFLRERLK